MADDTANLPVDSGSTVTRDEGGKFLPGIRHGPGRAKGNTWKRRQHLIDECIDDDKARELINRTYYDALNGIDPAVVNHSRKLLWPHLFGNVPANEDQAVITPQGDGSLIIRMVPPKVDQ